MCSAFYEKVEAFHVRAVLKICFCLVLSSSMLTCFVRLVTQHFKYLLKILFFLSDLSMVGQT